MRKLFLYFFIIFLAVILQTGFIAPFFSIPMLPDIVLMLVLSWTIIDGFNSFLPWLILAGLLYDFVSFDVAGTHVIIFVTVSYIASFISKRLTLDFNPVGVFFVSSFVFIATLISRIFHLFFEYGISGVFYDFSRISSFTYYFVISFVFNIFFFILAYYLIKKSKNFFYLKN